MSITLREQVGFDLPAADIDRNFYELGQQVDRLDNFPPVPLTGIVDVQFSGDRFNIFTLDGQRHGPFIVPQPDFTWRGDWTPATSYNAFDVFNQPDHGIFLVRRDYTSGGAFDPEDPDIQNVFGPLVSDPFARPVYNVEEAALDLSPAVAGWYLRALNGCEFTILSDAAAGWVDGANFIFRQVGPEPMSFVSTGGVTINVPSGMVNGTSAVGSVAYLRRTANNTWDLWGDLNEE